MQVAMNQCAITRSRLEMRESADQTGDLRASQQIKRIRHNPTSE